MAVSAAIALAGLGVAVYGAIQKSKAQKAANANTMPTYNIPQSEYTNLALDQSLASQGMSASSRTAYNNNANNALAETNSAILKGGGDANSIGNAYQQYNNGNANMAIYDDQARMRNLQNLINQNARMSSFQDKSWQLNNYAPWANKAQALAGQIQGDQQLMTSGFNTAVQGASGFAKSFQGGGGMPDTSSIGTTGGSSGGSQMPQGQGGGSGYEPFFAYNPNGNYSPNLQGGGNQLSFNTGTGMMNYGG